MNDKNQDRLNGEVNEIAELLDRSLEHYRAAEPRPGLEQRLLARIASAPALAPRWGWQFAATAGVAILSLVALYVSFRPASSIPMPGLADEPTMARAESAVDPSPLEPTVPVVVSGRTSSSPESVSAAPLVRATFPASRELSEQERLLFRFLQTAPRETQLALVRAESTSPITFEELSIREIVIEPLPGFDTSDPVQGG